MSVISDKNLNQVGQKELMRRRSGEQLARHLSSSSDVKGNVDSAAATPAAAAIETGEAALACE